MQKITPFLWFDGKAEEAGDFYVSIIKESKIGSITRYVGLHINKGPPRLRSSLRIVR
jgi:predicted 3-demethylubiquinone-9 3-methyltransferase (glyoxalase superfamily)